MYRLILRRLIQAIPTFFGITILAYALMSLTPGGPLAAIVFQENAGRPMSAEAREALERRLGISDPLPVQYVRWLIGDDWMVVEDLTWYQVERENGELIWLHSRQVDVDVETQEVTLDSRGEYYRAEPVEASALVDQVRSNESLAYVSETVEQIEGDRRGVLRGDFGESFFNKRPVIDVLADRAIPTLELSVAALAVAVFVGLPVGIIAAVTRGGVFDNVSRIGAVILNSIPNFWFGLILLYFLAFKLELFPLGSRCETTLDDSCGPIYERWQYMVLPVIVLSAGGVANFSRYMRASMLDVIGQDYIRTARSKGLSSTMVWYRHGMRNALIPIATFLGPSIVGLLGGAVITEQVFNYPGIGFAVFKAFIQRDYPIVMAVTIYASVVTILGYLLSDILYGLIDPRIRY